MGRFKRCKGETEKGGGARERIRTAAESSGSRELYGALCNA